jgi:tRNA (mo5U34)-methyltransferase
MAKDEIQAEAAKISWFHSLDLGHGIVTRGYDDSPGKLPTLGIPDDLSGKTVLDVGAWDGFFSFEAERRGAERVLATDFFCWGGGGWGTKKGFELARRALNSKVDDCEIDVLDLSPEKVGTFDLVLFLGVLYHMRHPLLCLEKVASVTAKGGMVIVETHVDLLHLKRPALAFYPDRELNNDPTNWFGPNPAAVEGMLRTVGFRKIVAYSQVPPRTNALQPQDALVMVAGYPHVPPQPDAEAAAQGRMVFHAWK